MKVKPIRPAKAPVIVRQVGQLNEVTSDGKKFRRSERITIPGMGTFPCAPYDNHFIYYDPSHLGSVLYCTCGSHAIIPGYTGYKQHGSDQGLMIVCAAHALSKTGRHADGSQ